MYNTYLYHHGILGQHWGKKNGPPYPLDTGDHSASEKKAGWRKSLSKSGVDKDAKNGYNKDTGEKKKFTLTSNQKKAKFREFKENLKQKANNVRWWIYDNKEMIMVLGPGAIAGVATIVKTIGRHVNRACQ